MRRGHVLMSQELADVKHAHSVGQKVSSGGASKAVWFDGIESVCAQGFLDHPSDAVYCQRLSCFVTHEHVFMRLAFEVSGTYLLDIPVYTIQSGSSNWNQTVFTIFRLANEKHAFLEVDVGDFQVI